MKVYVAEFAVPRTHWKALRCRSGRFPMEQDHAPTEKEIREACAEVGQVLPPATEFGTRGPFASLEEALLS